MLIEIDNVGNHNPIIGCIYNPPNNCPDVFGYHRKVWFGGDLNFNLLNHGKNQSVSSFLNGVISTGFVPQIMRPTRINSTSASLIDIFCYDITMCNTSGIIVADISDHFPVFCFIKCNPDCVIHKSKIVIRAINSNSIQKFRFKLTVVA